MLVALAIQIVTRNRGRQRACCDVAHNHLDRNDLHFANELLAHVEALNEVRRHADLAEPVENELGDAIIENAFALYDCMFLGVEGGRVILEVLNERTGLRALIEHLGLTLINTPTPVH